MLTIRAASRADALQIRHMILELAEFDKMSDQVRTTEEDLVRDGFGANPEFRTLIAEWSGKPAAFAVFFNYYSTWRGAGLYLEDLFVRPDFRSRGIGAALLAHVAHTAEQEGRTFVRWMVLDWNQPAIEMYTSLGSDVNDAWRAVVLSGENLSRLAARDQKGKFSEASMGSQPGPIT